MAGDMNLEIEHPAAKSEDMTTSKSLTKDEVLKKIKELLDSEYPTDIVTTDGLPRRLNVVLNGVSLVGKNQKP